MRFEELFRKVGRGADKLIERVRDKVKKLPRVKIEVKVEAPRESSLEDRETESPDKN